ncbi:hypothetical protein [Pseudorhodoplanes sp.]|uniref:hypothetical protein n=1 Tax=Pseudorhodoplanes sp. TaxID=1934341 RepID=UPI002C426F17|nr:hypothetical protein [Pseudorhodoplanes sp.]HWV54562.1 hypothetical protein [Pseudorhodoplanes sp.]
MRLAALTLILLVACGSAFASEIVDRPASQAPQLAEPSQKFAEDSKLDLQKPEDDGAKPDENWWQKITRDAPSCKSFTDGCRICSHTVCSNIGIACQPKEWSCNDANSGANPGAEPDAKPETKPDEKPQPKQ